MLPRMSKCGMQSLAFLGLACLPTKVEDSELSLLLDCTCMTVSKHFKRAAFWASQAACWVAKDCGTSEWRCSCRVRSVPFRTCATRKKPQQWKMPCPLGSTERDSIPGGGWYGLIHGFAEPIWNSCSTSMLGHKNMLMMMNSPVCLSISLCDSFTAWDCFWCSCRMDCSPGNWETVPVVNCGETRRIGHIGREHPSWLFLGHTGNHCWTGPWSLVGSICSRKKWSQKWSLLCRLWGGTQPAQV